jgi:hypothetical protein
MQKLREKIFKLFFKKEKAELEFYIDYIKQIKAEWKLPDINYADTDDDGNPPHFLDNLSDTDRKNYIASLSSLYVDPKFKVVVDYTINKIANKSMHVVDEDNMRNGRYAIIGIRTLMNELKSLHHEFLNTSKRDKEDFDPFEIL